MKLTQETLKKYLRYDPKTGIWMWRKGGRVGKRAGNISTGGHRQITICYKTYLSSALAYMYVLGRWPFLHVDHKDGIAGNDKWVNLREATRAQNISNSKLRKDSSTGYKGVSLVKATGKYHALIAHEKKRIHLGYYDTPTQAHWRYCKAARELKGEFSRFR